MTAIYHCRQCGIDDHAGFDEHARLFHTVQGLIEAATKIRDAERAKQPVQDPTEALTQFNEERAERIKLTHRSGWENRDRISFEVNGREYWLEIPRSLSLADKLRCIDLFLNGIAQGKEEGRYELQGELLDLIGAARRE